MDAQKRRMYSAMLSSLAGSFGMAAQGRDFIMSFNAADVAEMLREVSIEIAPAARPADNPAGQ